MITVAKIAREDLAALTALYSQLADTPVSPKGMLVTFEHINTSADYYLLGAKTGEGALVGTVMGVVCMDLVKDCRPFMVMENMVVDREWWRRGVGIILLRTLESIARRRRCLYVQFCSSMYRSGAHRFYEAAGYAPEEVRGFRKWLD